MTEYSFYNCIDTGMQRQHKAYVATRKLSIRLPILLPMQKKI